MNTDEIFAPLRERPVPPLDVDLGRAMATGRRRVRVRRTVAVAGTAAFTTLAVAVGVMAGTREKPAPPSLGAPPGLSCRVSALPLPPGETQGGALAVDPSGRYAVGAVAGSEETGEQGKALLWDNGRLRVLDVPGFAPTPLAVSSTGVVVGGVTRDHRLHAWAYVGGKVVNLADDGEGATANGVNGRGDMVGVVNRPGDISHAVMWPAGRPEAVHSLSAPGVAGATAISEAGVVVGFADSRPYVWDSAFKAGRPLPALSGGSEGGVLGLAGGWVVGTSGPGDRPVVWNLARDRVEPVTAIKPAAVTTTGTLVGTSAAAGSAPPYRDASILVGGKARELPHLTERRDTDEAAGVSADGRVIVGRQATGAGAETPLLWRC
ncbi:hypothetical protein [Actinoplanes sp. NPDC089786]|uniref:hypothetical protein n=1 Tax=Actinoplanes sp. NPDC089786 TaxID=3155185 RepID=UPI0034405F80